MAKKPGRWNAVHISLTKLPYGLAAKQSRRWRWPAGDGGGGMRCAFPPYSLATVRPRLAEIVGQKSAAHSAQNLERLFRGGSLTGTATQGFVMVEPVKSIDWQARGAAFIETAPSSVLDGAKLVLAVILNLQM